MPPRWSARELRSREVLSPSGDRSIDVAVAPRNWTRRERVDMAHQLRAGMATRDIARRLGVAPSTVRDYLSDPDSEKARRRLARRPRGACSVCGRETGSSRGARVFNTCRNCARRRRARWTREIAIDAYCAWWARFSVEPTSTEWNRTHAARRGDDAIQRFVSGRWPTSTVIVRLFGSWARFAVAARSRAASKSVSVCSQAHRI